MRGSRGGRPFPPKRNTAPLNACAPPPPPYCTPASPVAAHCQRLHVPHSLDPRTPTPHDRHQRDAPTNAALGALGESRAIGCPARRVPVQHRKGASAPRAPHSDGRARPTSGPPPTPKTPRAQANDGNERPVGHVTGSIVQLWAVPQGTCSRPAAQGAVCVLTAGAGLLKKAYVRVIFFLRDSRSFFFLAVNARTKQSHRRAFFCICGSAQVPPLFCYSHFLQNKSTRLTNTEVLERGGGGEGGVWDPKSLCT